MVNTALSVMAYYYPLKNIPVYVSDDDGYLLTLFAFIEAASFARHWLPFCRENGVEVTSSEAYFNGGQDGCLPSYKIKVQVPCLSLIVIILHRGVALLVAGFYG